MPRHAVLPQILPARLDLDVYRGDTLQLRVMLKSSNLPVDISYVDDNGNAWSFEAHIRQTPDGPKIGELDVIVMGEESFRGRMGFLRLMLSGDKSQMLPPLSVWDLESIDPNKRVRTLIRGELRVTPDTTRPEIPIARGGR